MRARLSQSLKRALDTFQPTGAERDWIDRDAEGGVAPEHRRVRIACKLGAEYAAAPASRDRAATSVATHTGSDAGPDGSRPGQQLVMAGTQSAALAVARRHAVFGRPQWHAPWRLHRVISGHLGWVRAVCVDPGNEWFATGSADRTIKIWDVATGSLRLTLTGHIGAVRGLAVSSTHTYLYSCGDDKTVKAWDLERNEVVRHFHGHLSGVYCLSVHPRLDVLVTGGRDSSARVWDARVAAQVHVLEGHTNSVMSLATQALDPQVVTGSMDCTVRMWDLAAGRCTTTLTHHKKGVRAVVLHDRDFGMMSGAADAVKKWKLPKGELVCSLDQHKTIVNAMAISKDDVVVSAADNGSMCMWDWATGYNFQQLQTIPQPGSLDSEAGIFAACFDQTGLRLITCEADKSIKMWRPDETATPESHPLTDWQQQQRHSTQDLP